MKVKEMIYRSGVPTKEILCEDEYKGYHFVILSYGTHPCAYVEVPKTHPYYKKNYHDLDIEVHGCLTYEGKLNHIPEFENNNSRWFIGWDYAHCGDYYAGLSLNDHFNEKSNDKKWSTHEIISEAQFVINQLIKAELNINKK